MSYWLATKTEITTMNAAAAAAAANDDNEDKIVVAVKLTVIGLQ